ncbi:MAG: tRNA 2-thiocytidine(32) synthetase TtcA [Oscillospiraceae bacterium]|nr:tRNA 2-thiocytidine(32) synthetase TtcA [Oscillospiraceae bacterium]
MQHILALVRRCVEDYRMIEEGDTIAVGVSGGKDSVLLLAALAQLRKFYPKKFDLVAITIDSAVPGMDFEAIKQLCVELEIPYHIVVVPTYEIVFLSRKEKNPCSLCAKMRRGALSTELNRLGISKIALGHHYDDAVETMLMNLFLEGRIGCFQPVTYLDRTNVKQLRPMLYVQEREVINAVARLKLPVVDNPCPANGATRREEMKELLVQLEERYPNLKKKIFGAIQRYPLYGWSMDEQQM